MENDDAVDGGDAQREVSNDIPDAQTAADPQVDDLQERLDRERARADLLEEGLKRTMADFRNLERKTESEIENGVRKKTGLFLTDFFEICDDFARAREAAADETVAKGFDSIAKNIDLLLTKHGITEIKALGEIFDPQRHEAVVAKEDDVLDDGTITAVIRKGYISRNGVIRPALVEVSKRSG